jgi:hypothetical protein
VPFKCKARGPDEESERLDGGGSNSSSLSDSVRYYN